MTGRFVFATVLLAVTSLSAQAQTVKVEFLLGKVNLVAQNASLRAILTEWSRVGGTRLINPERLSGAPITLELAGVPERQALDILLRDVGGYMVGPRAAALVAGVSSFDRLVIVTATAGRAAPPGPAFAAPRPTPQIGRALPPPVAQRDEDDEDEDEDDEDDDEDEPAVAAPAASRGRPPGPALSPGLPPLPASAEAPAPTPVRPTPGNPFGATQGSATPGTIAAPTPRLPGESESERILRDQGQQGR